MLGLKNRFLKIFITMAICLSVVFSVAFIKLHKIEAAAEDSLSFPGLNKVDLILGVDNFYNSNQELKAGEYSAPSGTIPVAADTFTPCLEGTAGNSAVIGTVTERAAANQTVVVTGSGFTNSTVWLYAQTTESNGKYFNLTPTTVKEDSLTFVVPDVPYGMYIVWVQAEDGTFSNPAIINAAKLNWISETKAVAGQAVSLYGTNLSFNNEEDVSYVYLRSFGSDGALTQATVTEVNPYKVTFTVPTLTVGNYEVWLSNGHGGEFGFSGPQKLEICSEDPYAYNGSTITVGGFAASDVKNAINSSHPGDTIYFPEGTYEIGEEIWIYNDLNLHLKGDGVDKTIIKPSASFLDAGSAMFHIRTASVKISDICFKDPDGLTDMNAKFFRGVIDDNSQTLGTTKTVIENCSFIKNARSEMAKCNDAFSFSNFDNVTVKDCYFKVPHGPFFAGCQRVKFIGNELCGNYILTSNADSANLVQFEAVRMLDASNNEFYGEDFITDPNGRLEEGDKTGVRAICLQQNSGPSKDIYIAENSVNKMGNNFDNSGELVLFEHPFNRFEGKPTSSSGNTVTFENDVVLDTIKSNQGPVKGAVAIIVKGKGAGQYRQVEAISGNVVTLQSAFTIAPDSTSNIMIANVFYNAVMYKNTFDGYVNYYENFNAGCGFWAYGSMVNFRADSNHFSNLMSGIRLKTDYTNQSSPMYNWFDVLYGVIIENNTIENTCWGIWLNHSYTDASWIPYMDDEVNHPVSEFTKTEENPATMSYGTIIRGNNLNHIRQSTYEHLSNICGVGISVGSEIRLFSNFKANPVWEGDWVRDTVVEDNNLTDCERAYIYLMRNQKGTVVKDNTLIGATDDTALAYEEPTNTAGVKILVAPANIKTYTLAEVMAGTNSGNTEPEGNEPEGNEQGGNEQGGNGAVNPAPQNNGENQEANAPETPNKNTAGNGDEETVSKSVYIATTVTLGTVTALSIIGLVAVSVVSIRRNKE